MKLATGNANCKIWEEKCRALNKDCENASPNGPPNAGKVLTVPFKKFENIPPAANEALILPVGSQSGGGGGGGVVNVPQPSSAPTTTWATRPSAAGPTKAPAPATTTKASAVNAGGPGKDSDDKPYDYNAGIKHTNPVQPATPSSGKPAPKPHVKPCSRKHKRRHAKRVGVSRHQGQHRQLSGGHL